MHVEARVAVQNPDDLLGSSTGHANTKLDSLPASSNQLEEVPVVLPGEDTVTYDSGSETRFATNARFQIPESGSINGPAGTVSFQFEPGWSGDNQADASLVEIGDGRLLLHKNVSFLRLEMKDDTGTDVGTGVSLADWQPGEPHYVTATWGNGTILLYVDGKLAAQQRYTNAFDIPSGTPVYVGTGPQNASVAPGSLSNIQLWKEPLAPGDIADQAAQVLQKTE